ncbi:MAG: hypothetical protein K9L24_04945 [Spirochaetia bacterium]|nr:hypothetical protein [Spirochaetia bacterium]
METSNRTSVRREKIRCTAQLESSAWLENLDKDSAKTTPELLVERVDP